MKRLLIAAAVAACTLSAHALPSIDAVQAELAKGHDAQAEEMMREVVAAKPDSARARYVYAEILAHKGRFALAAEEAAQARRLDPALSFTQPEKFKAFTALLDREQATARTVGVTPQNRQDAVWRAGAAVPASPAAPGGGVPAWAWVAGAGVLAWGAWRWLGSQQAGPVGATAGAAMTAAPATTSYGPAPAYASAGATSFGGVPTAPAPYGVPAPAARAGNGLLGTGLAVAGGVAAGMLAKRLMEGHREPTLGNSAGMAGMAGMAPLGSTLGSWDAAPPRDDAAQALEERPVDMGTGDGWGGADVDIGGDSDTDASSGSDGW